MEAWRKVWRNGIGPVLSTRGLDALANALRTDDPRLLQGATTSPPPLQCVQDWTPEGACVMGFCGWQGEDLETVGQVEEYFGKVCWDADQRMGEPAMCRWFLNWVDDAPRSEMRRLLLHEVEMELAKREPVDAVA